MKSKGLKHIIFSFLFLYCFIGCIEKSNAQCLEMQIQDAADILNDHQILLAPKLLTFKDKTGIEIYVLTSYQLAPANAMKFASRCKNSILIVINPFDLWYLNQGNWEKNVKIFVSNNLESKLPQSSRNTIVSQYMIPHLEGADIFSKEKFYKAIEKGVNELDFIVDPPPLELIGIECNGELYGNGDKIVVEKKVNDYIFFNPKEKYGRENDFIKGKMVMEGGSVTPNDMEGVGIGTFSFDISNASSSRNGFPVTLSYENSSVTIYIVVVEIILDKDEYVVNEGRDFPEAIVYYSIKPQDLEVEVYTLGDLKATIKGTGSFKWIPFDNTGFPYSGGNISFVFKYPYAGENGFFLGKENIKIIPSAELKDLVAEQLDDEGVPTGRKAKSGETLFLVKKTLNSKKQVRFLSMCSGLTFVGEPMWYVNGKSLSVAHMIKDYSINIDAFKGGDGDNELLYITDDSGENEISVEAYSQKKNVRVVVLNDVKKKSNDLIPNFAFVNDVEQINKLIFRKLPIIPEDLVETKIGVEYETTVWPVEKENSPTVVENESKEVRLVANITGKVPIYKYPFLLPIEAKIQVYSEISYGYSFGYKRKKLNEYRMPKLEHVVGGSAGGHLGIGVEFLLASDNSLVEAEVSGGGIAKGEIKGEFNYKVSENKFEFKGDIGQVVLDAYFRAKVSRGVLEWEIYNYNYSWLFFEGVTFEKLFDGPKF